MLAMSGAAIALIVIGAVVVLGLLWLMLAYNRLVQLRNQVKNAWAQIDVQLKRRWDLIPNLVETVKGYAAHERDVLTAVIEARGRAAASTGSPESQAGDEKAFVGSLRRLFAVMVLLIALGIAVNFAGQMLEFIGGSG
jgi:LemA protein